MIGEGSTGRQCIACSKAILERVCSSKSILNGLNIVATHDEVVQAVDAGANVWIVVICAITSGTTCRVGGDGVAIESRAGWYG
jgi:hypothetical protein